MTERSREERFDEVFQIILLIVALSFDILWFFDYAPVAEIAVFMFVLVIWAYGNLRGDQWEYPLKLGSFNFSTILLTRFYLISVIGSTLFKSLSMQIVAYIILPSVSLFITMMLVSYLGDSLNQQITQKVIFGGTIGYIISNFLYSYLTSF